MTADAPQPAGPGPTRSRIIAVRVLLGAIGAITLMTVVLGISMRMDDAKIEQHRGTATATVLSISALRTGIEFIDGSGEAIRPSDGVLYPGLLSVGQRFMVEYSTVEPRVVRVAGRTAAVGNVGLALTAVGTWLVGGSAIWLLRRPPGLLRRRLQVGRLRRRSPTR